MKISACIITYNHEKYIRQCLEGAISQKLNCSYEIVIGEDLSTDHTLKVCREYAEKYPELIRILPNSNNLGMARNWSRTISSCVGEYIALCEGDDYWTDPLKLQKQVNFLDENPGYGLLATDFNILHQWNGKIEDSLFKNDPVRFPIYTDFQEFLLAAGYMAPCTWVFRNEFSPSFEKANVDVSFVWLLEFYAKSKVYVLLETTAVYRVLTESASHSMSKSKMHLRAMGILNIQLDYIDEYKLPESFKLKVLMKHYRVSLPLIILLGLKDEIDKALIYIPKNERNFRDRILLFISKISLGDELLRVAFFFKEKFKM